MEDCESKSTVLGQGSVCRLGARSCFHRPRYRIQQLAEGRCAALDERQDYESLQREAQRHLPLL